MTSKSMSWDDVRFFLHVVKCGTVSAAAIELGVSHATVLRRIQQLESDLETRLFDHFQSGYRPTAAAEDILVAANSMQSGAEAIVRQLKAKDTEPEGVLRIASPELALMDLSDLLQKFCAAYPKISLDLSQDNEAQQLKSLKTDVAFFIGNTPPEDLVGRQITQLQFAYYDAVVDDQTPRNWVLWQPPLGSDLARRLQRQEQWLSAANSDSSVVLRSTDYGKVDAAVRSGLGAGLLVQLPNAYDKRPQAHDQQLELIKLDLPDKVGRVGVWVLTHQELRHTVKVKVFMEFVAEHFSSPV